MSSHHKKPKPRAVVKPMLRKLTHEKHSLDLDRATFNLDSPSSDLYGSGNASRSLHDLTYTTSTGHSQTGRRGYHNRSTSGTSQFSTATQGSGHRNASFVHPFQQTPRPYTPPTHSYQGSLMGSELSRDSPTVPEEEASSPRTSTSNFGPRNFSSSTSPKPHTLRLQTSISRLQAMSQTNTASSFSYRSPDLTSPSDSISSLAAVRTSMDKGFRLRSRSDALPRTQADEVREARRKFEQKEQAKDEKRAREEERARAKKEEKEARQAIKGRRMDSIDSARPRRSRTEVVTGEKSYLGPSYNNIPVQQPAPRMTDSFDRSARSHTAASNTKRKTQSTWTAFMMWLRTRILRIKRHANSSH